jgi:hypothetical protein
MATKIHVIALNDKEVIDLMEQCGTILGGTVRKSFSFGEQNLGSWEDSPHSELLTSSSRLISAANIGYQSQTSNSGSNYSLNLSFERNLASSSASDPSPFLNALTLGTNNYPSEADVKLYALVWAHVSDFVANRMPTALEAKSAIIDASVEGLRNLKTIHEVLVRELAEQSTKITEQGIVQTQKLNEQFEEKERKLFEDYQEKEENLSSRLAKLNAREALLDNRSHMHVRRELRQNMGAELKSRLAMASLPKSVGEFRFAILFACGIGIVFFAWLTLWSLNELSVELGNLRAPLGIGDAAPTPHQSYYLMVKSAFSGFGLAVTLFYLLGWLKKVHDTDLRSERDLERFRYDLDRASWVIETVLEAKENNNKVVPSIWLEAATRSMFAKNSDKASEADPLDALGALLNLSAKAEIGMNGTKLEIGQSGLKKAVKAHDALNED